MLKDIRMNFQFRVWGTHVGLVVEGEGNEIGKIGLKRKMIQDKNLSSLDSRKKDLLQFLRMSLL